MESAVKITVLYHTGHIKTNMQAMGERRHIADRRNIHRVETARLFLCNSLACGCDSILKHRCNGLKIKAFKGILRVIFFTSNTIRSLLCYQEDERYSHGVLRGGQNNLRKIHQLYLLTSSL
jgi:hypothetical protein